MHRWTSYRGMITGLLAALLLVAPLGLAQQKLLIYMDLQQTDHLKAYGIAYWALTKGMRGRLAAQLPGRLVHAGRHCR